MDEKKGIPENSSIVMPRLFCRDAAAEMEFCSHTFGALELNRRPGPDGKVAHGLMAISGEMIMIEAEWPDFPARAPQLAGWNLRLRRRCGSSRQCYRSSCHSKAYRSSKYATVHTCPAPAKQKRTL